MVDPKSLLVFVKKPFFKEAAEAYLEINELEVELRFDIITIVKKTELLWLSN